MPRWRSFGLALVVGVFLGQTFVAAASLPQSIPVLNVYIPGQFAGCTASSPGTSESLKDVLSLVRPSAFNTHPTGRFVGAGGPISSAELVSDDPQTIVITIDPNFSWSNGIPFSVDDILARIDEARTSRAAWADGFHRIARVTVGHSNKSLTVVFSEPYASWPMMFQSIESRFAARSCDLMKVAGRPSLGPYLLESLTSTRAVLVANPQFRIRSQQFRTVVVTAGATPSSTVGRPIVDYRYSFSQMDLTWLASLPGRSGKIATSQNIAAVTFSPRSSVMSDASVRKVLSLSIDRYSLINQIFGSTTQSIFPAASSLLAQGQSGYPSTQGDFPFQVTATTSTTQPGVNIKPGSHEFDCVACATNVTSASVTTSGHQLRWNGSRVSVRLAVGPSSVSAAVAARVVRDWSRIGVAVRLFAVASDRQASQAVAGGSVDAAVTTAPSGYVGSSGATWSGPRRPDTVDFGWRSAVCNSAASAAEADFNATTSLDEWSSCDRYIAAQYWQRPLASVPYVLQWTNTVVGVQPSNTTRGFINQIPLWSSLQRR